MEAGSGPERLCSNYEVQEGTAAPRQGNVSAIILLTKQKNISGGKRNVKKKKHKGLRQTASQIMEAVREISGVSTTLKLICSQGRFVFFRGNVKVQVF